jgi:hypothetical protein
VRKYFKHVIDDLLFLRVVMILWSALPFAIVGFSIRESCFFIEHEWFLIIPIVAAAMGCWVVYIATLTDDTSFEKRLDLLEFGGHPAGILFAAVVFVVAVPIYETCKLIRTEYEN